MQEQRFSFRCRKHWAFSDRTTEIAAEPTETITVAAALKLATKRHQKISQLWLAGEFTLRIAFIFEECCGICHYLLLS